MPQTEKERFVGNEIRFAAVQKQPMAPFAGFKEISTVRTEYSIQKKTTREHVQLVGNEVRFFSTQKSEVTTLSTSAEPVRTGPAFVEASPVEPAPVDDGKRGFLKLAGIVGLGVVASQMLPKSAEAYVMGGAPTSGVVGMKDSTNARINPAKEDGNLASIKTSTDTFVAAGGGAYVRQDSTATIALETGGNLASIKTNTDKFTFDGNNNLMTTTGGVTGSIVGLQDMTGVKINPSTDDSILYLRRMVKLMESQAAVDQQNRQRITIDSITAGLTLSAVTNVTTMAGWNQQMFSDVAQNAYANALRSRLTFT